MAEDDRGRLPVDPPSWPRDRPDLFAWAVGSFHAAVLVAAAVAALHGVDAAGDVLASVGTLSGAVAYLYLWALAVWTAGRGLAAGGVTPAGAPDTRAAIVAATAWGAVTGLGVFVPGLVLVGGLLLGGVGVEAVPAVVIVGTVGAAIAAALGAVVAAILASLDLAALRTAAALADGPPTTGNSPAPDHEEGPEP